MNEMNEAQREVYEQGRADGKTFCDHATRGQLNRLRRLYDQRSTDPSHSWDAWFDFEDQNWTVGERLFLILSRPQDDDRDSEAGAEAFWAEFSDADPDDPDYVRGFAEGALGLES